MTNDSFSHALGRLAPDAAARDAAKRSLVPEDDGVIRGEDVRFLTRNVSDVERAAVLAVLTSVREEETNRVRSVRRTDRDPWARSQRSPERIRDPYSG